MEIAGKHNWVRMGEVVAKIEAARAQDPLDTLLDILAEGNVFTLCSVFGFREDDVVRALIQPWASIGVDAAGTAPEGALPGKVLRGPGYRAAAQ